MNKVTTDILQPYLERLFGAPVGDVALRPLVEGGGDPLKAYGYGTALRLDCRIGGKKRTFVLSTMRPSSYGHDHMEDRAQALLWEYRAFGRLPRHTHAVDVGGFTRSGEALSLADMEEPFLLIEHVEGNPYADDLVRIRDTGELLPLDLVRAEALCDYLVEIHAVPGSPPGLYVRRIRELIGHGECIMGILDGYPPEHEAVDPRLVEEIERRCLAWRWRLRPRTHRLRQVHGDFHPWNILFREGADFSVIDRARGEFGDPADDVASITMNYLFFGLQRGQRLEGPMRTLYLRFWRRYLERSRDEELLEVVAPFLVFRALVMASPVWYPALAAPLRRRLLRFCYRVLDAPAFAPEEVDGYCDEPA